MFQRLGAIAALAVLFIGCNPSTKDMIVGRWNYDRMESDPNSTVQYDDFTQAMMQRVNAGKYYEFYEDGTCEIGEAVGLSILFSDYEIDADGKTVDFFQNRMAIQAPISIRKITETEMWLDQGGQTSMVFVKQ